MHSGNENAENKNNDKKSGAGTKAIGISALILILLMVIIAVLSQKTGNRVSEGNTDSPDKPIYTVLPENIRDIKSFSSGVACLTGSNVEYIDASGKKLASNSHLYAQPVIETNKSTVLLYDKGGTSFRIERNAEIYNTYTVQGEITLAKLGRKNNYAYILNDDSGYQSHLFVYSYQGKKQFEWGSASDYCIDAVLSPDGKSIALSVVGVDNAAYYSKVMLFNFNKSEPVISRVFEDTTVFELSFVNRNTISFLTEKGAFTLNADGDLNNYLEFSTKEIYHSSFSSGGLKCIAIARFGDTNNFVMDIYNKKQEYIAERSYKKQITALCSSENYAAVAMGDIIEIIDKNNTVSSEIKLGEDCLNLVFSGRNLYVHTLAGIYKFNLNQNIDLSDSEKITSSEEISDEADIITESEEVSTGLLPSAAVDETNTEIQASTNKNEGDIEIPDENNFG